LVISRFSLRSTIFFATELRLTARAAGAFDGTSSGWNSLYARQEVLSFVPSAVTVSNNIFGGLIVRNSHLPQFFQQDDSSTP
jgi:hypothetical protein